MTQPPYGQMPQPGWGQQPQQPPQQYGPPPQQGYGPPQGAPPPPASYGYGPPQAPPGYQQGYGDSQGPEAVDWEGMYNQSDPSQSGGFEYAAGRWLAVCTEAAWGPTRNGDKSAWKIKFQFLAGPDAGKSITTTNAVSPRQRDGQPNTFGMTRLFEELSAFGIPVGEKYGDPPGTVPFFRQYPDWNQAGQAAAQAMVSKQVEIEILDKDRSRVDRIRKARAPQPAGQQPAPVGYQPGPPAQGYAQAPPQPQNAYPPNAGQGGLGQFTTQGQAQQPGMVPQPPQQAAPAPAAPPQGQPPLPFPGQQVPGQGAAPPQQNAMPGPAMPQQGQPGTQPGDPGGPPQVPWTA